MITKKYNVGISVGLNSNTERHDVVVDSKAEFEYLKKAVLDGALDEVEWCEGEVYMGEGEFSFYQDDFDYEAGAEEWESEVVSILEQLKEEFKGECL
ncbi:hypothetical protein JAVIER_166 [Vibrio phage Javier]|nr:hypothetical protein JAVIER_166 [Vibrio phage Javier]